jgi:glycine cleavage system H lipoate-binding protein/ABC-type phosphate transport system substrate-binding protein
MAKNIDNLIYTTMKNLMVIIASVAITAAFSLNVQGLSPTADISNNDSIYIWSSNDLAGVASTWIEAYKMQHQDAKIGLTIAHQGDLKNLVSTKGTIGIVSKATFQEISGSSKWSMVVGREVVVPIMNSDNPYKDELFQNGISPKAFNGLLTTTDEQSWGKLLDNETSPSINFYIADDEVIVPYLNDFLKSDIKEVNDITILSSTDLLKKIQTDKYAIGFCKLSDIINTQNNCFVEGVGIIPIDVNENNKLDYFENIYSNLGDFSRGIWIGKYPNELYSRIFTVAGTQNLETSQIEFLEWLITDGQKAVTEGGFTQLTSSEISSKIQNLHASAALVADLQNEPTQNKLGLVIFALAVIVVVGAILFFRFLIPRGKEFELDFNMEQLAFTEDVVEIPGGLFFDKSHTWAYMEKEGLVKIGIDDFLQHITGSISKVKMKEAGEHVKKGDVILSIIQHGKKLNIYSPISGIIKENNSNLHENASLINKSPYAQGWIYSIESENWLRDLKTLAMGETYKDWIKKEFVRLKDFLALAANMQEAKPMQYAMQDGGELKDNPLENCTPEVWEEFQTSFLDISKEQKF